MQQLTRRYAEYYSNTTVTDPRTNTIPWGRLYTRFHTD